LRNKKPKITNYLIKIKKNKYFSLFLLILLISIFIILLIYTDLKFATEVVVFLSVLTGFYLKILKYGDILKELTIIIKKGVSHEVEKIIIKENRIKAILNSMCDDFNCDIVSIWGYHNGIKIINNKLPFIKSSVLVSSDKHLLLKRPFSKDLNVRNDSPEIKLLLDYLWKNGDILITKEKSEVFEKEVGKNNLISSLYNENGILSSYIYLNKRPLYSISLDWIKMSPYERGNFKEKISPYIKKINQIINDEI